MHGVRQEIRLLYQFTLDLWISLQLWQLQSLSWLWWYACSFAVSFPSPSASSCGAAGPELWVPLWESTIAAGGPSSAHMLKNRLVWQSLVKSREPEPYNIKACFRLRANLANHFSLGCITKYSWMFWHFPSLNKYFVLPMHYGCRPTVVTLLWYKNHMKLMWCFLPLPLQMNPLPPYAQGEYTAGPQSFGGKNWTTCFKSP